MVGLLGGFEDAVVEVDLVVDLILLDHALGGEEFDPEDDDVEVVSLDGEDEFPI